MPRLLILGSSGILGSEVLKEVLARNIDCISPRSEELDIRNSQPLFLALILSKNIHKLDKSEYEFFRQCVTKGKIYEVRNSITGTFFAKYIIDDKGKKIKYTEYTEYMFTPLESIRQDKINQLIK
jgi:hypothetical protein